MKKGVQEKKWCPLWGWASQGRVNLTGMGFGWLSDGCHLAVVSLLRLLSTGLLVLCRQGQASSHGNGEDLLPAGVPG